MENNITSIILNDEEGNEVEFDVITKFDIEDKEYVIVVPKNSGNEEAIALRIDKDANGEDVLVTVEDDEEFELVSEAYETLFSEEYDVDSDDLN